MKTKRFLAALFLAVATVFTAAAQNLRTVTGKVVDTKGEPVVGAYVMVKGTTVGTSADLDGNYELRVDGAAVLEVSSIGYVSTEVTITKDHSVFDVVLREDAMLLDDAVVIGYGVQNRRDVTTSIASIKAEDFANRPNADFREAMAAKMPGVQVLTLGGQPEGNVSVRVRGIQSATSGNDPLYVIDGIPCDSRAFANLDGSEIESLEVLKDASAAAIYGSRGSCGVIMVTTKRGTSDKTSITYDGQFSVSSVAKKIDMMGTAEWAEYYVEARNGSYLYSVPTGSISDPYDSRPERYHTVWPYITKYLDGEYGLPDTDWQDEVMRTAYTHKHNLSLSGKSGDTRYFLSLGYLNREGIVLGSDFERYNMRLNLDGKKGRFTYGASFAPSYSITNQVSTEGQYTTGDGVIASALMCAPIFKPYNADGSYNWDMAGLLWQESYGYRASEVTELQNPVALAKEITDRRAKMNVVGNAWAAFEIIEGLTYKLTLGGDFYSYGKKYYRPSWLTARSGRAYVDFPATVNEWETGSAYATPVASTPKAISQSQQYLHWNISNQLNYVKKIGDHSISAVAAYEAEKYDVRTMTITGTGTPGDDKIRTTKGKTIADGDAYNDAYSYGLGSWLVRGQYSWKGRYMASASIRRDASTRFAPNSRWGYFPAASVGWRISDEPFMQRCGFLSDMKVRASVGQTGNDQIGNSKYLALYTPGIAYMGDSSTENMMYSSQIANNDLHWEKNTQYNIGVDAILWQGLLGVNLDLYHSKTTDMLFDVPVPDVSGMGTSTMNIGSMQNRGIEITMSSRHQWNSGWSYEVAGNFSLNRNKVLHLGGEDAPIIKTSSYGGAYYITQVGQPVGCYYLLVQDGVFHNQEELDSYPHFASTAVGDFRFIDVNGDGILQQDLDRAVVGNYMPDFYYGFNFNVGYKSLDLSAAFQGVYGNEILNLERRYICNMEFSANQMTEAARHFPYGNLNRATRKSTGYNGASQSTFHLEDGSYLRLQSLTLGYTLPSKLTRKAHIQSLRVYLQGTNLLTFTNYTGYNPEVNKNSTDALRPGEDYCTYPLPRTVSFGVNFTL